ncbi:MULTISPECIES: protein DnrP [Pseudomonas]|uniref:protein DnrP n=1 Tax=Pseudomonas TaxID=286 RepID=UPI0009DD93A1|nr:MULTISPECIES: protein DnrP [Pseudomonas]PRA42457.1 protein DnrP [Pseudomonas sp. MYb115]WSO26660.1 protein DnrP [Pseudomonas fluorescens]
MNTLPVCLYCQHPNPAGSRDCHHCGMLLPLHAAHAAKQRLRRFQWFCIGLSVFCVAMFFWLPR